MFRYMGRTDFSAATETAVFPLSRASRARSLIWMIIESQYMHACAQIQGRPAERDYDKGYSRDAPLQHHPSRPAPIFPREAGADQRLADIRAVHRHVAHQAAPPRPFLRV